MTNCVVEIAKANNRDYITPEDCLGGFENA